MSLNLFVPQVEELKTNAAIKDLTVLTLSSEFPLTMKQIHFLLAKKYGIQASTQATFKALKELTEKKVLVKDNKKYCLNKAWINKLKTFITELEENYQFTKGLPVIEDGENLSLTFNTIAEVDKFILTKLECYPKPKEKIKAKIFLSHLWWPLFYSFKEYLQIKDISEKINLTINCKGNTTIDKWCAKYYTNLGFKARTGIKHNYTNDLIIFQDYIIQIFYPKQVVREIKKAFSKYKKIEQISIVSFYSKIFEKKVNIQVLINKNPELAKQIIASN